MLQNIFRNMTPVVKNLLILNGLFFLAKFAFEQQGIVLSRILGMHYVGSDLFKPYQLATHFFMHADFFHILFNMFALVVFGNMLERVWGSRRFLLFYFITALGAAFLHQFVQGIEVYQTLGTFFPDNEAVNSLFTSTVDGFEYYRSDEHMVPAYFLLNVPTVGASGAVYGLLAAVALLFPNTVVYLYFAIPVKMKWLALGGAAIALFAGFQNAEGDSVAHFAHLGGMLFGFILVKIWQKDNSTFY